jgi:hypothetical protein
MGFCCCVCHDSSASRAVKSKVTLGNILIRQYACCCISVTIIISIGIGGYLCFVRVVSMFPIPAAFVVTLEQVVAEDILRQRDGPQPQVAAEGRACASILQWWTRDGLFRMSCQHRIRPSSYTCQHIGMHVCMQGCSTHLLIFKILSVDHVLQFEDTSVVCFHEFAK